MGSRAGRPYIYAVLPAEDFNLSIRDAFYSIIDSLSSAQQLGLGRALYINPESIRQNYKTRRRWPGIDVAERVIEWDKNGRPLITRKVEDNYSHF